MERRREERGNLEGDLGDRTDQLREGANSELYGGWPMILSGLKTLIETGGLLTTPGSLMYANPGRSSGKR